MKPDWDKLMRKWNKGERSRTTLIADVDCTDEGKQLCLAKGVKGFPTMMWGDPASLKTYTGQRDYETLKQFAKDNLKLMCSPDNIDECDDKSKDMIEELRAWNPKDLSAKIKEIKKEKKDLEDNFEAEVKRLREAYEQLQQDKEANLLKITPGLVLMQEVSKDSFGNDGRFRMPDMPDEVKGKDGKPVKLPKTEL